MNAMHIGKCASNNNETKRLDKKRKKDQQHMHTHTYTNTYAMEWTIDNVHVKWSEVRDLI